jgi:predicted transcriptional regulator
MKMSGRNKRIRDEVRQPTEGYGDGKAPGPYAIVPARATVDERFHQYPMTLVIFTMLCSHANPASLAWPNFSTMGKKLGISNSAISKHFRKLQEWGYVECVRRGNQFRAFGRQGAVWRVVYDPEATLEDAIAAQPANRRDENMERDEALKTLNAVAPQGNCSVDNSNAVEVGGHNAVEVQGNMNYKGEHMNKTIDEKGTRYANLYRQEVKEKYKKDWRYGMNQVEIGARIAKKIGEEEFITMIRRILKRRRDKGEKHPISLKYFEAVITPKPDTKSVADIKAEALRSVTRWRFQ